MENLVEGIYSICKQLQPLAIALVVLSLVILGLGMIFGGADAAPKFKETMKWIVIGAAVSLCATSIGTWITGFFL